MELKIIGNKEDVLAILKELCYRYGKNTTIGEYLKLIGKEEVVLF